MAHLTHPASKLGVPCYAVRSAVATHKQVLRMARAYSLRHAHRLPSPLGGLSVRDSAVPAYLQRLVYAHPNLCPPSVWHVAYTLANWR